MCEWEGWLEFNFGLDETAAAAAGGAGLWLGVGKIVLWDWDHSHFGQTSLFPWLSQMLVAQVF